MAHKQNLSFWINIILVFGKFWHQLEVCLRLPLFMSKPALRSGVSKKGLWQNFASLFYYPAVVFVPALRRSNLPNSNLSLYYLKSMHMILTFCETKFFVKFLTWSQRISFFSTSYTKNPYCNFQPLCVYSWWMLWLVKVWVTCTCFEGLYIDYMTVSICN